MELKGTFEIIGRVSGFKQVGEKKTELVAVIYEGSEQEFWASDLRAAGALQTGDLVHIRGMLGKRGYNTQLIPREVQKVAPRAAAVPPLSKTGFARVGVLAVLSVAAVLLMSLIADAAPVPMDAQSFSVTTTGLDEISAGTYTFNRVENPDQDFIFVSNIPGGEYGMIFEPQMIMSGDTVYVADADNLDAASNSFAAGAGFGAATLASLSSGELSFSEASAGFYNFGGAQAGSFQVGPPVLPEPAGLMGASAASVLLMRKRSLPAQSR